jgi:hypothetical protein
MIIVRDDGGKQVKQPRIRPRRKKREMEKKNIYVCSERKKNEQMNRVLVYIVHALLTFFSISIPVR